MTAGDWVRAAPTVARTFGPRGLLHRGRFELRKRLHRFRREPKRVADAVRQAMAPACSAFTPDAARIRNSTDRERALLRAERVLAGEYEAYRWSWTKRPGSAAEWTRHPDSGFRYALETPWYEVQHFDPRAGDIKDVWEPARFGWAFDLARGWILTGNPAYAETFAKDVDDFLDSSPPFRGVHWSCGQETAIRATAWIWCEAVFAEAAPFQGRPRERLREAMAWSAERIEDAIDFAISQRNNHGLSEATGLVALGARFAGIDPRAHRWIATGAAWLDKLIPDQFASDGWYIQHSFAYMRLALDQLVVARRALRLLGRDLSPVCLQRIASAIDLLAACADPRTGEVPNHGPNDGSFVLPLTTRSYSDFRPSLTAATAAFGAALPASMPLDMEVLAWLGEEPPRRYEPPARPIVHWGPSGWAIAETLEARVFVRAGKYRSRPGHIDPGHIDVWLRGAKSAVDAGTYRYFAPPPWRDGLAGIDVHNTLSIEGLPAAERGPRFLWLRWPSARIVSAARQGDDDILISIENNSWRRAGIAHRRACHVRSASVVVVDEVDVPPSFHGTVRVQWLLEDGVSVAIWSTGDATLIDERGAEGSTLGWVSEGYGVRRAIRSLHLDAKPLGGHVRVVSAFGDSGPTLAAMIADEKRADVRCVTS